MAAWPYSTARWQRLRRDHLALYPLCQGCAPRTVIANTVDHKVAINQGGDPFPDHDGLNSYCASCHSRKTARGPEHGAVKASDIIKGSDEAGWPLDPNHAWNIARAKDTGGEVSTSKGATLKDRRQLASVPQTQYFASGANDNETA